MLHSLNCLNITERQTIVFLLKIHNMIKKCEARYHGMFVWYKNNLKHAQWLKTCPPNCICDTRGTIRIKQNIIKQISNQKEKQANGLPAPSMTDGLLVFVQLVIAAITTEPWFSVYSWFSKRKGIEVACLSAGISKPLKPTLLLRHWLKSIFMSLTNTLSWGRFGPLKHDLTVPRSSSTTCKNFK